MYISLQIMCPRLPRVNHHTEQNAWVTWVGGEGSEAGCYTVLIHNFKINILCHRTLCTLTGLNVKYKFIGVQRTLRMVCLHCCFGPSEWSEEIHRKPFVTQKTRPTWCRLPACRWHNHSLENQNYTNWVVLLFTNEQWPPGTIFILNCSMWYVTVLMKQINSDTTHTNCTNYLNN